MTVPILQWLADGDPTEEKAGLDAVVNGYTTYDTGYGGSGQAFAIAKGDPLADWYALSVVNNALFNFVPSGEFAIRFYCKLNSYTPANPIALISKGRLGAFDWGVGLTNSKVLAMCTGTSTFLATDYTFSDTSWHDVLVNYNNGYYTIYVDSVDIGGANFDTQRLCLNNTPLLYFVTCFFGRFDGYLDNIRIYDEIITVDNDDNVGGAVTHAIHNLTVVKGLITAYSSSTIEPTKLYIGSGGNGSWRISISGNDLAFFKRESDVWNEKGRVLG